MKKEGSTVPTENTIRVLLVEDDEIDAERVRRALTFAKDKPKYEEPEYQIEHVTLLADAIKRLSNLEPLDVLMLDLGLPDSAGMDTVMSVLDVGRQLPIVIFTGQDDHHSLVQGVLALGVQDYLVKGRESDELLRRSVCYALERHKLLQGIKEERRKRKELLAQHDIAEEAEQASVVLAHVNDVMSDFTTIASHELRAPLQTVNNLSEWIADRLSDALDDEALSKLTMLRDRITRTELLLDDLLAYSRAGRMGLEVVNVDVMDLLGAINEELAPPNGFSILADGKLPCFRTALIPFYQVLRNLIDNAIKHHDQSSEGNVTISARDAETYFEFTVADDGPGIQPKNHKRIFGMFQTLLPRDQARGSGVGLAIVRKIIDWNGGDISVESDGDRGTTFTFTWNKSPGW
ncbi:MAG: hybrid sensor histidine kinase/response regulator [Planctomycetales bacterium]